MTVILSQSDVLTCDRVGSLPIKCLSEIRLGVTSELSQSDVQECPR